MEIEEMNTAGQKPDIEFRRRLGVGHYRTYGHIYFKPFVIHLFGKTIIGKKHLKREESQ